MPRICSGSFVFVLDYKVLFSDLARVNAGITALCGLAGLVFVLWRGPRGRFVSGPDPGHAVYFRLVTGLDTSLTRRAPPVANFLRFHPVARDRGRGVFCADRLLARECDKSNGIWISHQFRRERRFIRNSIVRWS